MPQHYRKSMGSWSLWWEEVRAQQLIIQCQVISPEIELYEQVIFKYICKKNAKTVGKRFHIFEEEWESWGTWEGLEGGNGGGKYCYCVRVWKD